MPISCHFTRFSWQRIIEMSLPHFAFQDLSRFGPKCLSLAKHLRLHSSKLTAGRATCALDIPHSGIYSTVLHPRQLMFHLGITETPQVTKLCFQVAENEASDVSSKNTWHLWRSGYYLSLNVFPIKWPESENIDRLSWGPKWQNGNCDSNRTFCASASPGTLWRLVKAMEKNWSRIAWYLPWYRPKGKPS